jgi:hypothetical protein
LPVAVVCDVSSFWKCWPTCVFTHLILCRCRPAGGVKTICADLWACWRRQALVFWLSRWTAIHRREARCLDELNLRLNLLVNSNFEENLNYFLMAKNEAVRLHFLGKG